MGRYLSEVQTQKRLAAIKIAQNANGREREKNPKKVIAAHVRGAFRRARWGNSWNERPRSYMASVKCASGWMGEGVAEFLIFEMVIFFVYVCGGGGGGGGGGGSI